MRFWTGEHQHREPWPGDHGIHVERACQQGTAGDARLVSHVRWHKTGTPGAMAHLLVADDDPGMRDLLLRFLTDEGYYVETAVDGPQALAMIAASPPDLLITDLAMPDVTGWDVCTQAHRQVPHLPVIIISAVGPGVLQTAPAFPEHVLFLPKPFSLDLLLETMSHLLENSQAIEAAAT